MCRRALLLVCLTGALVIVGTAASPPGTTRGDEPARNALVRTELVDVPVVSAVLADRDSAPRNHDLRRDVGACLALVLAVALAAYGRRRGELIEISAPALVTASSRPRAPPALPSFDRC